MGWSMPGAFRPGPADQPWGGETSSKWLGSSATRPSAPSPLNVAARNRMRISRASVEWKSPRTMTGIRQTLLSLSMALKPSADIIGPGSLPPLTPGGGTSPPESDFLAALTHAPKGSSARCASTRIPLSLAGSTADGNGDPSLALVRNAPIAAAKSAMNCHEDMDEPLESEAISVRCESRPARYAGFARRVDRKSTRLNSSHLVISYAVFCLK